MRPMAPRDCSSPHFVFFFKGEASARKRVTGYVVSSLRDGLPTVVIAKAPLLQHIRNTVHREHVEGTAFGRERGELVLLDAVETLEKLCVDGKPDAGLFRAVVGSLILRLAQADKPVAAYGEMVGVLCERGQYDDAVELERLWNELLAEARASLFCGYARSLFDSEEGQAFYAHVCAKHTSAYDETSGFVPRLM